MMKNKSSNDCEFDTDFSKLKRKTKKLPSAAVPLAIPQNQE